MKHYTHKPVELKKLTTQTINFKRFYETPDGNLYPSITTVLSTRNKKGLFEWRKKVGDEVANYVARVSAIYVHKNVLCSLLSIELLFVSIGSQNMMVNYQS